MRIILTVTLLALSALSPKVAIADGDVTAGQTVFHGKCSLCHAVVQGQNRVGPSLFGVVGRKAGSLPDYTYSPANSTSGKTWDAATLFTYLANPQAMVPGTKMTFGGLPDPTARTNLIAYLSTMK